MRDEQKCIKDDFSKETPIYRLRYKNIIEAYSGQLRKQFRNPLSQERYMQPLSLSRPPR